MTPDSFSDGGKYFSLEQALEHAYRMAEEGADIIDVGGASSRPDSVMVDEEEEIRRVLPVVQRLAKEMTVSVDTFRGKVARAALEKGAHLINDIGCLKLDPDLLPVLAQCQAPVVVMHNRMQMNQDRPYRDLIADMIEELKESLQKASAAGLPSEKVIIDPGVGFGKTPAENRLIIQRLRDFESLGRPILLGTSRKSFIGQTLDLPVGERMEGSLATVVMGIMNGAAIVRVHDVKESKRAAAMTDAVMSEWTA